MRLACGVRAHGTTFASGLPGSLDVVSVCGGEGSREVGPLAARNLEAPQGTNRSPVNLNRFLVLSVASTLSLTGCSGDGDDPVVLPGVPIVIPVTAETAPAFVGLEYPFPGSFIHSDLRTGPTTVEFTSESGITVSDDGGVKLGFVVFPEFPPDVCVFGFYDGMSRAWSPCNFVVTFDENGRASGVLALTDLRSREVDLGDRQVRVFTRGGRCQVRVTDPDGVSHSVAYYAGACPSPPAASRAGVITGPGRD